MTTYAQALADPHKKPVWILDLTAIAGARWANSREYAQLSSAAKPFLRLDAAFNARVDLRDGKIDFDEVQAVVLDEDGSVASLLAGNDAALRGTPALLKSGFLEVAESEFQAQELFLDDWGRTGSGGFFLKLRSALSFLDSPLFEDFDDSEFPLRAQLTQGATSLSMAGDATAAGWRPSGNLLLHLIDTDEVELIAYSSYNVVAQNETRFIISQRRKFAVGAVGKVWPAESTQVRQAWALQDDPVRAFLRLATTTGTAGANGPYDVGDGDGLGAKVPWTILDRTPMLALVQEWLLGPDGKPHKGLWIGTREVDSLLDWFAEEFLFFGFRLSLTGTGKLGLQQVIGIQPVPVLASGKFANDELAWDRGYREVENNARWAYDWNPADRNPVARIDVQDELSQTRYGKSKLRTVTSRGARGRAGTAFGFPDLGWDRHAADRASDYIVEFSNPSDLVEGEAFVELKDTAVGQLFQLSHPGIFDLEGGKLGITDRLVYVTGLRPRPEAGRVALELRVRRLIGRPQYVADDFDVDKYLLNFSTSGGEAFAGYTKVLATDIYPVSVPGGTVGWISLGAAGAEDRDALASPSEIYDSYCYALNDSLRVFRIDAAIKRWRVRFAVGDATQPLSELRVEVNGKRVIDGESTQAGEWIERDLFVDVVGVAVILIGIGGGGSSSTRTPLCWVRISEEDPAGDNYDNASAADKQFWYASPDTGDFPDGGTFYDAGI